ncbi:tail fiber protein [Bradyrhizobium lablabi]|nr:tail fiber protein [Bradyrhizobium lablabi]
MFFYKWSKTAASNATADSAVNWAEGMAPSAVNDSGRAMMASVAGFRDDISGATVTGGSASAYTLGTYQVFDSLANMHGKLIAFTPHVANNATVTLAVDGLTAKPLRFAPGVELQSNTLVAGTPYCCYYHSTNQEFYLQALGGNTYGIPLGGCMQYFGSTTPSSAFVFPYGQAISRTTYASFFALVSTTFGSGDGSTTFNVPDLRGRVLAGRDDMGGSAASRLTSSYFGTSAAALGAVGGGESHTLTLAQLPTGITSANASQNISVTVTEASGRKLAAPTNPAENVTFAAYVTSGGSATGPQSSSNGAWSNAGTLSGTTANSISVTSNNTSGNAHRTVQPTIICNHILRVI